MFNLINKIQSISIQSPNMSDEEPMDDEQLDAIIKDLTDSADKLQTILDEIDGKKPNQVIRVWLNWLHQRF